MRIALGGITHEANTFCPHIANMADFYAAGAIAVGMGDSLFEIAPDPTPQELLDVDHRVRSAEARFDKAKADWERGQELHVQGLMSKGDLDALEEQFEIEIPDEDTEKIKTVRDAIKYIEAHKG